MSPTSPRPHGTDETPSYYRGACCPRCEGPISPWDLVADLDFLLGNVVKYAFRAGDKPGEPAMKDLIKCRSYLDRAIDREARRDRAEESGN